MTAAEPAARAVDQPPPPTASPAPTAIAAQLSLLDRYLPAWIGLAMAAGLLLGKIWPGIAHTLDKVQIDTVSLPIAICLFAMLYPVLASVRYNSLATVVTDRRSLTLSLTLNWLVGPALMFTLAWALLPDLPDYRTGLIIVGLARCIAMVLIWNNLAHGSQELAVVLVAINSLFQIVAYSLLGYFYLQLLPTWLGLDTSTLDISLWAIARSTLIFLGLPLAAGLATRHVGQRHRGTDWYENRFLPRIAPISPWALLATIVILFALQGDQITSQPWHVARIAAPLIAYFAIMWSTAFLAARRLHLPFDRSTSIAFTAAGNNFDLAIAIAIAVFGVTSGQALAATVGPLIEVPALIALVYLSLHARSRLHQTAT